ncbi:aspartate aminotransferase family protein [Thermaurantimonas aggregans]|uniref:Aspartate aminotransferase family protein n=1 Tax=Thermaurantimonas aggregans TaxID=2173829 RepID=A0A401XLE2_9FLAO|nr:aspartate aminotransferase family protein [Thermaurantimonas aggregans]MCX8148334.1 aspartate aminotransferase family protein [Thermaurantimonas aggregans]GCD77839.1 aspartate aminotransferase family protein [Thermaurantimonas aggregans]
MSDTRSAASVKSLFFKHLGQTTQFPVALHIAKAEGHYLIDSEGKKYLDLISGISVSNIGHCHPRVVEAVQKQVETYMHTMVYGEYIQNPQVELAHALHQATNPSLEMAYLVNSGAEAIEGTMKLAKRYTGRPEIIYCRHSYHGSTQGALSVMGGEEFKQAFRPLIPGCRMIEFNNFDDLKHITKKTAAVITEVVQSESGYVPADVAWLTEIRKRCDQTGALLVLDEIQTGFGRTGALFGFQKVGIVPDILVLAKGMGGGMPIGAFMAPRKLMMSLTENPILGHITTFGGHPVSAAAALATLQVVTENRLWENAFHIEKTFRSLLRHPMIHNISGVGAMMAIELSDFDTVLKVIGICMKNGLLIDWFLFNNRSLRVSPPLTLTDNEMKRAAEILLHALDTVQTAL